MALFRPGGMLPLCLPLRFDLSRPPLLDLACIKCASRTFNEKQN